MSSVNVTGEKENRWLPQAMSAPPFLGAALADQPGNGLAGVRRWRGHRVQPLPSCVFVAAVPDVGVALQVLPGPMSANGRDMRDIPTKLEQPGNAFVTQVVEMQVLNLEELACLRECSADRRGAVREDPVIALGLRVDDPCRFLR